MEQSLLGVWSMAEAEGRGSGADELYVFGDDGRGACIYSNNVAQDIELFRWTSADGHLTFEPLRSVWVGGNDGRPQERSVSKAMVVRYSVASERNDFGDDLRVLRLDPTRGTASCYAASLLSNPERRALREYVGLDVGPELVQPLRTESR